jgi:hypothetical protein
MYKLWAFFLGAIVVEEFVIDGRLYDFTDALARREETCHILVKGNPLILYYVQRKLLITKLKV